MMLNQDNSFSSFNLDKLKQSFQIDQIQLINSFYLKNKVQIQSNQQYLLCLIPFQLDLYQIHLEFFIIMNNYLKIQNSQLDLTQFQNYKMSHTLQNKAKRKSFLQLRNQLELLTHYKLIIMLLEKYKNSFIIIVSFWIHYV